MWVKVVGVGNGLKIKEKGEKSLPRTKSVLKTLKGKDIKGKALGTRLCKVLIAFVRTHPNLVFLWQGKAEIFDLSRATADNPPL